MSRSGRVWVVNDVQTCIPGTRTLWHDLAEWLDAEWVGDRPYPMLADYVEARARQDRPSVIIRNGTWFGPINLDVPTITLIQDIMPEGSYQRGEQVRVARCSNLVVYNSEYTRSQYTELSNVESRTIPLSVDFDLFRPKAGAKPLADICWVGAPTWVKGWDLLGEIIRSLPKRTFALILKEHSTGRVPENVQVFTRIPHSELPALYSGCQVGLCTSRQETQHLAGIEMAGCGLPVVAPNIGAYYQPGLNGQGCWNGWAYTVGSLSASSIERLLERLCPPGEGNYLRVRQNVLAAGFTRQACEQAWKEAAAWSLSN